MRFASASSTSPAEETRQRPTSNISDDAAINAICTFVCLTIALVVAIAHTLARLGFEDLQILSAIKGLAILAVVVGFPSLVRRTVSIPAKADGLLICGALVLLAVLGVLLPYPFGFALACVAGIAGILCTVTELPSLSKKQRVTLAVATIILSAWAAGYLYAQSVHDPLVLEMRTAHGGRSDSIFHSALIENLKTYGIISTGVDGVQPFHYHTASHRMFSVLADLTDETALSFYLVLYPIFIPALFLRAFLLASNGLRSAFNESWTLEQITSPSFWLLSLTLIVGCIPRFIRQYTAGLAWGQPYASESYATSLLFFFLGLSVVSFLSQGQKLARWGAVLFTTAWLALLTATKVTWLLIGPLTMGFLLIRDKRFKSMQFAAAIPLAVAAAYAVNKFSRASECQGGINLSYWDWFKYTGLPGHDAEFVLWYHFPLWALIALSCLTFGIKKLFSPTAKETVLPQLIAGLSIAFFIFTNVIELKGAAGLYFIDPIRWMALLTFMTLFSWSWISQWKPTAKTGLAVTILLLLVVNAAGEIGKAVDRNLRDRRQLAALLGSGPMSVERMIEMPQKAIAQNQSYQIIQRLRELRSISRSERQQALLFIPQSCKSFWTMCHDRYGAFTGQALSGIAMFDGLLPVGMTEEAFGFASYRQREAGEIQPTDKATIVKRAKSLGFKQVIALDSTNGELREHIWLTP